MSLKTKISSVKLDLPNKSFTAKAIPYQVLDEEQAIKTALADDKVSQKEKELLQRELEKPFNKRNQALMNKYRGRVPEVLNGWPLDVSSGGYNITAVGSDEKDIPMEFRPQPWYAKIDFKVDGNNWLFKFPIKKETSHDGSVMYKLDNYNTWIQPDGTIVDSMSDELTPYTELKRFVENDEVSDWLKSYLIDPNDDESAFHFKFPNFYVKYIYKKRTAVQEDVPTENIQMFDVSPNVKTSGSESVVKNLLGLADVGIPVGEEKTISRDNCVVTEVRAGKAGTSLIWLLFTGSNAAGTIHAALLSGAAVASTYLGLKRVTSAQITAIVKTKNAAVLEAAAKK